MHGNEFDKKAFHKKKKNVSYSPREQWNRILMQSVLPQITQKRFQDVEVIVFGQQWRIKLFREEDPPKTKIGQRNAETTSLQPILITANHYLAIGCKKGEAEILTDAPMRQAGIVSQPLLFHCSMCSGGMWTLHYGYTKQWR